MDRDTVLVVGAGASMGARWGDDPKPPLGSGLAKYLLDWHDANKPSEADPLSEDEHLWRVKLASPLHWEAPAGWLFRGEPDVREILVRAVERSEKSDTGFEHVMAELLHEEHRRHLDKINVAICFALLGGRACAFAPKPDLYDQLFSKLRTRLRAIVTPNYDLLCEEALERVGLKYRYRGYDDPTVDGEADVVIDKFHGSANFLLQSGAGSGSTLEAARASSATTTVEEQKHILSYHNSRGVHASVGDRRKNAIIELKLARCSPVLVTYGPGKDSTHGRPFLNDVRAQCDADLVKNPPKHIIAIGVRPPRGDGDDDAWEDICQRIASLDCKRDYWNKEADQREGMAAYGFEGRHGYMRELIDSLEA
jgi:hypothetical protein